MKKKIPKLPSGYREYLERIARLIDREMPDGKGFIVLAVDRGEDGRVNYISNLHRENALNVMKEFLIKCGAEEDWMRHIK